MTRRTYTRHQAIAEIIDRTSRISASFDTYRRHPLTATQGTDDPRSVIEIFGFTDQYRPHMQRIIDNLNATFGPGSARLSVDSDYLSGRIQPGTIGIVMSDRIIDGAGRVMLPLHLDPPQNDRSP